LRSNIRCFGPLFPQSSANATSYFVTLFSDELTQINVSEHTKRSVVRRQISGRCSSGKSPYGYRFVFVLLDGSTIVTDIAIKKKLRIPGDPGDLEPHTGEMIQAEALCYMRDLGMKPGAMVNELRLRGLAQNWREDVGVELHPTIVTDKIKAYTERKNKIIEANL
jgi:hypothetical protein